MMVVQGLGVKSSVTFNLIFLIGKCIFEACACKLVIEQALISRAFDFIYPKAETHSKFASELL